LLFANPLPTPEHLRQHYATDGAYAAARKARAEKTKANAPTSTVEPRDVLLKALVPYVPIGSPPRGAKVLDFGCGDGKFLDRLQNYGWQTYGIEPSTSVAFSRHHRLEVPPQDGSFDLAILHHVLEHVTTPLEILRQLAGALREGGVLFVGVPRIDTLSQHGDFKYCLDGRHHLLGLSDTCLRGLLARSGFTLVARLDAPQLDDVLTAGKSSRLRLVATRTAQVPPLPDTPLRPAADAVAEYARARDGLAARLRGIVPIRMRGALLDRAIERQAQQRRRARAQR
jgi:2-polyprenyl-3-methyl-5-hydroxy-6-metoxy-1,4-benzoquinol methylase